MTEKGNPVILKAAVWAAFVSWLFLFVNALSPQIQMFLFSGRVVVFSIFFKFTFLGASLIAYVLRKKLMPREFLVVWSVFLCYLLFHGFFMVYSLNYNLLYVLFGDNSYYYYFLILPILPSLAGVVPVRSVLRVLMVVFVPLALVGLMQYLMNAPILPVRSIDGRFVLGSYNFFGKMRPTSFFSYPGLFSFYLVFMVFVFLNELKTINKHHFLPGFGMVISLFLIFVSYSRSTYVFFLCLLPAAMLLIKKVNATRIALLKYLPAIYIPITTFAVFLLSLLFVKLDPAVQAINRDSINSSLNHITVKLQSVDKSKISLGHIDPDSAHFFDFTDVSKDLELCRVSQAKLGSGYSFLMRLSEWNFFGRRAIVDLKTFTFGTGYLQNGRISAAKDFFVDNLYLNLVLHVGVIGLLLVLSLLWCFWVYILEALERDFFSGTIIMIFSTITILGFSGMILMDYMGFAMLSFFIAKEKASTL